VDDRPAERAALAATFAHRGVAAAYRHRPPYPPEVFGILERLITDRPRTVLDLGTGDGALARPLASMADQVDAIDISAAMVESGRRRPGGARPNLRWIVGPAETAELGGPYSLVTAGASLHWMSWPRTLPRVAAAMTEHACLAIVEHGPHELPWSEKLTGIIARHSRNPGYDPGFSLVGALSESGLFALSGRVRTEPVLFRQTVPEYVEQFHSTASLARELMPAQESAAFGRAISDLVRPYAVDEVLQIAVVADVALGRLSRARGTGQA
jgi:ubiquinone/menaquinone biosynthesis C-methylase UbiE